MTNKVDWRADSWFSEHYAGKLSEEFKDFWIRFYGQPSDYQNNYDEQHEYWVRCAFAWIGWSAAQGALGSGQEVRVTP